MCSKLWHYFYFEIRKWCHNFVKTKDSFGLLKNGSLMTEIEINKCSYMVINTCAFNTLLQVMLVTFNDSDYIGLRYEDTSAFCQLINTILRQGITTHLYRRRAEILLEILPSAVHSVGENCMLLDATTTLDSLIGALFKAHPSY